MNDRSFKVIKIVPKEVDYLNSLETGNRTKLILKVKRK
jgi:hypothetical protein